MLSDVASTILVCPRNDEESLQILKIAEALRIPHLVSVQPHGARLQAEPDLLSRLRAVSTSARQLVLVELPGLVMEEKLTELGYSLTIIDHHRYEGLDRMQMQSSLEQFLEVFAISDADLARHGFDPLLVRSVGVIDRGFFWELGKEGYSEHDRRRAISYYLQLRDELGLFDPKAAAVARTVFDQRREERGVLLFDGSQAEYRIREELSLLLAEHYPDAEPTSIIFERDGKVSVQNTPYAQVLSERFGGYQFGKGLCWGKVIEKDTDHLPGEAEILAIIA